MENYLILLVLQHVFPAAEVCCLVQLPDSSANILKVPWSCLVLCSDVLIAVLCVLRLEPGYLGFFVTCDLAPQLQRRAEPTGAFAYGKPPSFLSVGSDLEAQLPYLSPCPPVSVRVWFSRICWDEEGREMWCCYLSYCRGLGREHWCLLLPGSLSPPYLAQQKGLSCLFRSLPPSSSALQEENLQLRSCELSPPARCLLCALFKRAPRMGTHSPLLVLPKPQQMASFRLSSRR